MGLAANGIPEGFGEAGRTALALDNSGGGGFEWWLFCGIILALGCETCVETASGDLMLAAVKFAGKDTNLEGFGFTCDSRKFLAAMQ